MIQTGERHAAKKGARPSLYAVLMDLVPQTVYRMKVKAQ
jgi:hypothetical protein